MSLLSSNVVNYLAWRYLQEAGFGNAALQLSRCWIRDPETLPFASNMEPHTLIRILQDGMCFDQLQAEATSTEPRYRFGPNHGQPYSARNGAHLTLDKGIPAHELAAEANGAVQEPPPKKGVKRKKAKQPNGVEPRPEQPETTGDALQVEQNGVPHVTDSVRAESEAAASDADSPTVAEIPISTLSIGQDAEIQTEVIADLAPATIFVPCPKEPGKLVQHLSWAPAGTPVLVAAGKSVLQALYISKDPPDEHTSPVRTGHIRLPTETFAITALCWQTSYTMYVAVREECVNEIGERMMMNKLLIVGSGRGGRDVRILSSTAGLVNTLRYNVRGVVLVSISTDGEKGSVKVWINDNNSIPAYTDFTDTAIFDAVWISETLFVVCGIEIFAVYQVTEEVQRLRNLKTQVTWESVKVDRPSRIVATLGVDGQASYLGLVHPQDLTNMLTRDPQTHDIQTHDYPDPYPTDLDFRPRTATNALTNGSSMPSILLATCSMSGVVRIWDVNESFKAVTRLPTTDDAQALKIAFSPDGSLLAAAGPDAITVWDVEKRFVPVACWRAKDCTSDKWDAGVDGEFILEWDSDSSRLSIALGNQIAVIPIPR